VIRSDLIPDILYACSSLTMEDSMWMWRERKVTMLIAREEWMVMSWRLES
jgi:hypothetical protein